MTDSTRFALIPLIDGVAKPFVFPDIDALARRLERDRDGRMLQLVDVEDLDFQGAAGVHPGVQIWALNLDGAPETSLGYAWLDGAGRETLERALRRNRAPLTPQQQAA